MSKLRRTLLKVLGILITIAALGLGGHFLIRALIAMHS
jgi:hypothetical protein